MRLNNYRNVEKGRKIVKDWDFSKTAYREQEFSKIYKVASNLISGSDGRYMIQEWARILHILSFFSIRQRERVGLRLNCNLWPRAQQKYCRETMDLK